MGLCVLEGLSAYRDVSDYEWQKRRVLTGVKKEKGQNKIQDIFGGLKKALIFALPNKKGVLHQLFTSIKSSPYYSDIRL